MRNMAKFAGSIITVCITFLISLIKYKNVNDLLNVGIAVKGTVPGSIYSDLEKAGGYLTNGPLFFRFNDI